MGWVFNATPRLGPRPVTHRIGGLMGPRADMEWCGKSRLRRDSIPGQSSPAHMLKRFLYYLVEDNYSFTKMEAGISFGTLVLSTSLHGVTSRKTITLILIALSTSDVRQLLS